MPEYTINDKHAGTIAFDPSGMLLTNEHCHWEFLIDTVIRTPIDEAAQQLQLINLKFYKTFNLQ